MTVEYEAGESSGYADWVLALGEVLPDDFDDVTPSGVAAYLSWDGTCDLSTVMAVPAHWPAPRASLRIYKIPLNPTSLERGGSDGPAPGCEGP